MRLTMIILYILIGLAACSVLAAGLFYRLGIFILKQTMSKRLDISDAKVRYVPENFPGLRESGKDFYSGKNLLRGCFYSSREEAYTGIVVCVCGHRLFHRDYLPEIAFFAQAGYLVFAFDPTGCGESGGDCPGGQPQWILDTHAAITMIENLPELKEYPIYLYGHSTGAYAVCGVLNFEHRRVHGVAAMAPVNSGYEFGKVFWEMYPHPSFITKQTYLAMKNYEEKRFGELSGYTALKGINNVKIPVLIVQCMDDKTVQPSCSMVRHEREITNPGARILLLQEGGHWASRREDGLNPEVMQAVLTAWEH